jgi:hypothetical protein
MIYEFPQSMIMLTKFVYCIHLKGVKMMAEKPTIDLKRVIEILIKEKLVYVPEMPKGVVIGLDSGEILVGSGEIK